MVLRLALAGGPREAGWRVAAQRKALAETASSL
jgi:hypothetical protein